jgi:hypothetical protein
MVNFTMLVHNRPTLTRQALESLLTNSDGMTVTVGAHKVDGETYRMLSELYVQFGYAYAPISAEWGTGELRNYVIECSENTFGRGDYLYLSDNDVFFKPGWLDTLIHCYEAAWREGFKVLGAYNHPYHQPIPGARGVAIAKSLEPIVVSHVVNQVHALALQSMLMRWEVWDKYGPFCETPVGRVCASEDVDFARKITADGGKLGVVSPALVVNTGITNSFGEKIPGWELVKAQCPEGVICE